MKGKLITFEGIDRAGKSTQIGLLREHYELQNRPLSVYREPGGTELGEHIRSILLQADYEITPTTEFLMFSAARAQLVYEEILPALEQDQTVILDRFYDSSFAYQGYGKGVDLSLIERVTEDAIQGRHPDKTLYLHITPEVSARRLKNLTQDLWS